MGKKKLPQHSLSHSQSASGKERKTYHFLCPFVSLPLFFFFRRRMLSCTLPWTQLLLCAYACIFKFAFKMKSLSDMQKSEVVWAKVKKKFNSTWMKDTEEKKNLCAKMKIREWANENKWKVKKKTQRKVFIFLLTTSFYCNGQNECTLYATNLFVSFMTHWIKASGDKQNTKRRDKW